MRRGDIIYLEAPTYSNVYGKRTNLKPVFKKVTRPDFERGSHCSRIEIDKMYKDAKSNFEEDIDFKDQDENRKALVMAWKKLTEEVMVANPILIDNLNKRILLGKKGVHDLTHGVFRIEKVFSNIDKRQWNNDDLEDFAAGIQTDLSYFTSLNYLNIKVHQRMQHLLSVYSQYIIKRLLYLHNSNIQTRSGPVKILTPIQCSILISIVQTEIKYSTIQFAFDSYTNQRSQRIGTCLNDPDRSGRTLVLLG